MTPSEFIILAVLITGILYWIDTIVVKEIACRHGKNECLRLGVTFLDATVAITKTRLKRNKSGTVKFAREYNFEFSSDGVRRYAGSIYMLGKTLMSLQMSAYPDPTAPYSSESSVVNSATENSIVDINQKK